MAKGSRRSAGILLYRAANGGIEVLLAHPGGPVWAKRHAGAWSIPKGEIEEGEEPWDVARREFEEETGHPAPNGASIELGEITQKGGKVVVAWALEGDLDPATAHSNTFQFGAAPPTGHQKGPRVDTCASLSSPTGASITVAARASTSGT